MEVVSQDVGTEVLNVGTSTVDYQGMRGDKAEFSTGCRGRTKRAKEAKEVAERCRNWGKNNRGTNLIAYATNLLF